MTTWWLFIIITIGSGADLHTVETVSPGMSQTACEEAVQQIETEYPEQLFAWCEDRP